MDPYAEVTLDSQRGLDQHRRMVVTKKKHINEGDLFTIPIDDNTQGYGQIVEVPRKDALLVVVFQGRWPMDQEVKLEEIIKQKILFLGFTTDALIYHGKWVITGNSKANLSSIVMPYFKVAFPPETKLLNYRLEFIRMAAPEEDRLLNFHHSMSPMGYQKELQAPNKNLYNGGSELQDDFGDDPNVYSTFFREYDPVLGRMNAVDPMADKYGDLTPYNYAGNNPIMFNDPMGDDFNDLVELQMVIDMLMASEYGGYSTGIYDINTYEETGSFNSFIAGVDYLDKYGGWGKNGAAINFETAYSNWGAISITGGYNPVDAQGNASIINGTSGSFAASIVTVQSYKSANRGERPDADGYLTFKEANDWYRNGKGQPLTVDLSKLDLSGIHTEDFNGVGSSIFPNLLLKSSSYNDGLIYGSIMLTLQPNDKVIASHDDYDFTYDAGRSWWNPLNWPRHIETFIGGKVAGQGTPYRINFRGEATITPVHHVIK